jgi:AcrR family transcriptional regulator
VAATKIAKPSMRATQKESTRKRILATARRLFQERGIAEVAMEEIAAGASVGRATVYLHYSGKPALLVDLLVEDWERQARLFERLAAGAEVDRAAIVEWLSRMIAGMRSASESFELHRYTLGVEPRAGQLHREQRKRLAAILGRRFAAFSDSATGRRVEAALIIAELEYFAVAATLEWDAAESESAVGIMANRMLSFIGGPPKAR